MRRNRLKMNFVIDTDNKIRMIEYIVNFGNLCHFIGLNLAAITFTYAFVWGFTNGHKAGEKDGFTIDIDGVILNVNLNRYIMGVTLGMVAGFVAAAGTYPIGFGWFIFGPIVSYGFYVGGIRYGPLDVKSCSDNDDSSDVEEFETADEN